MENQKQNIELADIFSRHATTFLSMHNLSSTQQKAMEDIVKCRTSELGGHIEKCDHCGYIRQSYNSCRNRHCPKCQFVKKEQWVDKLVANLPPVKHFHVVFTIPALLHKLFYINQAKAYSLLMQAAGQTLTQCAKKQYAGIQIGAVSILHTWGQTLVYHPHVHMIVPAGGLSEDQMEWMSTGNKFFLPVRILSQVFRGVLCRMLESSCLAGEMKLPKGLTDFSALKSQCYLKNWVVYCEKPFSNSDRLIHYLGNYTHRVAISNNRIVSHENDIVRFSIKDYKAAGIRKHIDLDSNEFIRRFLQHVLPSGFCKIRYFGFLALRNMKQCLSACFELIATSSYLPLLVGLCALDVWRTITGKDPIKCPKCAVGKLQPQYHSASPLLVT